MLSSGDQFFQLKVDSIRFNLGGMGFSVAEPPLEPLTPDELQAIEADMSKRRRTLRSACSKHGLDQRGDDQLHQVNPWEYFVAKENKLVWCNVFKSGSSRFRKFSILKK